MATSVGLTVAVILLVVGWTMVRRRIGSSGSGRWPVVVLSICTAVVVLLLAWIAFMALVVGPSMREM